MEILDHLQSLFLSIPLWVYLTKHILNSSFGAMKSSFLWAILKYFVIMKEFIIQGLSRVTTKKKKGGNTSDKASIWLYKW